jgi:hypothetical protein
MAPSISSPALDGWNDNRLCRHVGWLLNQPDMYLSSPGENSSKESVYSAPEQAQAAEVKDN